MKQFIYWSVVLLLVAIPSFGQSDPDDISLPDPVMKDVLHDIVKSTIEPPKDVQLVYLANTPFGSDWLPEIRNVEFVLLDKNGNEGYGRAVYFWKNLRKEKGAYLIDFGNGDPGCSADGLTWSFRVVDSQVKNLHSTEGWGSGCSVCSGSGFSTPPPPPIPIK